MLSSCRILLKKRFFAFISNRGQHIYRRLKYNLVDEKVFNSEHYFKNKLQRQREHEELAFKADQTKLDPVRINFSALMPSFSANKLTALQYRKIIVTNKLQNHLQNSYVCLNLNLSVDHNLRNYFQIFYQNTIRLGRIIQILDSVAGLVSYRHCFGSLSIPNPFTIVTGSVQSLRLYEHISCSQDITIQGTINYCGRTSIQVQISLFQQGRLKSDSLFLMICRKSEDLSKGYVVPKLDFSLLPQKELEKALARYNNAQENAKRRKKMLSQSFELQPPNAQDVKEIHAIFLKRRRKKEGREIGIGQTMVESTIVMHSQQRNMHGKIFGGYLMREMVEAAWVTACKFFGSIDFVIEDFTNMYFKQAVEIGTALNIRSSITYIVSNITVVTVEAYNANYSLGDSYLACSVNIVLRYPNPSSSTVIPESYEEALHYVKSKETIKRLFVQ